MTTIQPMQTRTMRDLIDQGYLVDPVYYAPFNHSGTGIPASGDEPVRQYEQLATGKRAIVFCCNVEHAAVMAERFRHAGITAERITADMSMPSRKKVIDSYLDGKTLVLTTVSVMLDSPMPETDCVIVCKPTHSHTAHLQMVSAAARPKYADGMPLDNSQQRREAIAASDKPKCMILDFAGNTQRLGMPSN